MFNKKSYCLILLFCFFFLIPFTLKAEEPLPPSELIDWLDYALKRFPPSDCPHLENGISKCSSITSLKLAGDVSKGMIQLEFTGHNWSRTEQTLELLGPSTSFALLDSTVELSDQLDPLANDEVFIAPFFDKTGGFWKISIPPGKFILKTSLHFEPNAVMPINFSQGIGRVNTEQLKGGYLQFDLNTGNHGGSVQLVLEGKQKQIVEKPQIRGTRIFQWDSIPTFTYVISVSGLQSETPVSFPLLSDEMIETVSPNKTYNITTKGETRHLETTFSPTQTEMTIKGHYQKKPSTFSLGKQLPFEIWLYVANRRYPVNIQTNANPIDPSEFSHLTNSNNARAFLVKPGQKIAFYPISLKIDEGRKGKGISVYKLFEGYDGFWLEKLFLTATVQNQDRLIIPTPKPPIFAGIGTESIELYHDENNQLSVRLPRTGLSADPISIDWYDTHKINPFISFFKTTLPGQKIYVEKQDVDIHFRPGHVPLYTWGTTSSEGDLLDQFHLYGFLIGILAFFICRGLKFNYLLSALVAFLFIGLYQVPDFPVSWLLTILILTLPFARLTENFFHKLKQAKFKRSFIILIWILIFGITSFHLANYSRNRIYSALHPYADQYSLFNFEGQTSYKNKNRHLTKQKPSRILTKKYDNSAYDYDQQMVAEDAINMPNAIVQSAPSMPQLDQRLTKTSEWTAKPVSLKNSIRGGNVLSMTSYNLAPNQNTKINVLIAGPFLRALWLIIETVLILCLMVSLLLRIKKLFIATAGETAS